MWWPSDTWVSILNRGFTCWHLSDSDTCNHFSRIGLFFEAVTPQVLLSFWSSGACQPNSKQELGANEAELKSQGGAGLRRPQSKLVALPGIWAWGQMQNQGLGKNFLLGSWAFFSFQSRQLFQSWACIKSFYPIALESCLILISGSDCLCESSFIMEYF